MNGENYEVQDPEWRSRVESVLYEAPFMRLLGYRLEALEPGRMETALEVEEKHLQHHGIVHAGVQATMCDHTAGCAGSTLISHDEFVLTAEFKINLLRPCIADRIVCRSRVIKPGRALIVGQSDVFAIKDGRESHVSMAIATLAVVKKR